MICSVSDSPFPHVILVDEQDNELGVMEKQEAHEKGLLHRAFSIFVVRKRQNGVTEVLLQKRASHKYHSGGLWTNTACSHPQPNKNIKEEAQKCLAFEVGLSVNLAPIGHIIYQSSFDNGLTEHELDHVFVGTYEGDDLPTSFNRSEIERLRWQSIEDTTQELSLHSDDFTAWFAPTFSLLKKHLAPHTP